MSGFESLSRRRVLQGLGAGLASLGISQVARAAASAGSKPASAGPFKLGVFTSVYAGLPLDEAARRIREDGFQCVVMQYDFKDVHFDPANPDWALLKRITDALEKNHLEVVGLFGYHNVIDRDAARAKKNEQMIDTLIKNWKRFGSPIISTETGTFNPESQFREDPKNFTEEGYAAGREAFTKLARAAEKTKAVIAIEAYWRNLICSIERTDRLFRDVNSPSLKLTMDPCNYFRNEELPKMKPMLEEMFRKFGKQTVIAHAKDVKATDKGQDLPAAGLGVMDYPLYLKLLSGLKHKNMPLIVEHLPLSDVARARDFVKAQIAKL